MNVPLFNLGTLIDDAWMLKEKESGDKRRAAREPTINPRVTEASVKLKGKAYGSCLRKIYFRMQNEAIPSPMTAYSLRNMELGSHIETLDQNHMVDMNILADHNVQFQAPNPLYPKQEIRGEIDSLIKIPPNIENVEGEIDIDDDGRDTRIIVEHKTSYGYHFNRDTFGTKTISGTPRISYVLQLSVYLDLYPKLYNINVPYGILYYRSRGNGNHKQFDVMLVGDDREVFVAEHPAHSSYQTFDVEFRKFMGIKMGNVYNRYKQVAQYIEKNEIPPMDYSPLWDSATVLDKLDSGELSKSRYQQYKSGKIHALRDVECAYCPFLDHCMSVNKSKSKSKPKKK